MREKGRVGWGGGGDVAELPCSREHNFKSKIVSTPRNGECKMDTLSTTVTAHHSCDSCLSERG